MENSWTEELVRLKAENEKYKNIVVILLDGLKLVENDDDDPGDWQEGGIIYEGMLQAKEALEVKS